MQGTGLYAVSMQRLRGPLNGQGKLSNCKVLVALVLYMVYNESAWHVKR